MIIFHSIISRWKSQPFFSFISHQIYSQSRLSYGTNEFPTILYTPQSTRFSFFQNFRFVSSPFRPPSFTHQCFELSISPNILPNNRTLPKNIKEWQSFENFITLFAFRCQFQPNIAYATKSQLPCRRNRHPTFAGMEFNSE